MQCTTCSTAVDESGSFCPGCGASIAPEPEPEPNAEPTSATAASLVGCEVDGFAIEGVIGGGSFGTVYRARQQGLDRLVALKIPSHEIAADPVMARRFAREARAASRVHHPGVVAIYGVGTLPDDRPYLAMELVDGVSLERALDDGPLEPIRALKIARLIASALSETHAVGVVHRDLKPSNIVWQRDRNGDDRITIVDFGIAMSKPGTADATRLTQNGLIGTPHYMSPEQAQGETVDARADLYALGCILFELVTHDTPFSGSGYEVLLAHLGRPAPAPSTRNPRVPRVVDDLVLKLLAKLKESRFASADALVSAIDRAIAVIEGRPVPPVYEAPAPVKAPAATSATVRVGMGRRITRGATDAGIAETTVGPDARELTEADPAVGGAATSLVLRPAPSRARWLALGLAGGAIVATAAVLVVRPRAPVARAIDDASESQQARREVLIDSGDARLRVWIPMPLLARRPARFQLELRNKLGGLVHPEQMVVTVEDATGKAVGFAARPRATDPDHYTFAHPFAGPGHYTLRVFPPDSEADFELPLDVQ